MNRLVHSAHSLPEGGRRRLDRERPDGEEGGVAEIAQPSEAGDDVSRSARGAKARAFAAASISPPFRTAAGKSNAATAPLDKAAIESVVVLASRGSSTCAAQSIFPLRPRESVD